METWEVVVILVLITLAISVIAKHEVPLTFVALLDSTFFQLAILGATLGVAAVSPAVAIVSIATIVIVYYIRNLVKIQLATADMDDNRAMSDMVGEDGPRLEIHEQTAVVHEETSAVVVVPGTEPVARTGFPPIETKPHDATNKDVVETAMKEHESRVPIDTLHNDVGSKASNNPGSPPMVNAKPPEHENMENPRGSSDEAEPFDAQADFRATAPSPGTDMHINGPNVDSDIFSAAPSNLDAYNEQNAAAPIRNFADSAGQYNIGETRPQSNYGKYEVSEFAPGSDMGINDYKQFGVSIDDKMNNLKLGITPSAQPPPNFDTVTPPRPKAH